MAEISAQLDNSCVDDASDVASIDALPVDIALVDTEYDVPACDPRAVAALRNALELEPLVAQTLVRRGYEDPAAAKEFLDGGEILDPAILPGARDVAETIVRHVRDGSPIAVHGDYDVDGVCSTSILVRTLDRAGARVTWHVPSRFNEGYGLSAASIDRLAADGAGLIVAVDCGVTAVAEVEHARDLGVEVAICDHHTPGKELPDAPIAHPGLGDYPFRQLCAAAVVYKVCRLVFELLDRDAEEVDDELDLVGLATVCDVVPLLSENRALVRAGLAATRVTARAGLRELMRAAGVDQLAVDAGAFGFRLGPRINAAGRMYSAEPAVELMLTVGEQRAAELAEDLCSANARRQEVEKSILFKAETQARRQRDRHAIVVAGEGWHAGVLGIVAGRIAERFRRPCVALGIENGIAAGSGRSGGAYDLLGGLNACADHLIRFGGHRAAAGLQLDAAAVANFRSALQEHAANTLSPDQMRPRVRVDAVAEPSQLTLAAAEALELIGPFGAGNPEPAILVPAVTVTHVKRMGEGGRHLKLSIAGHGGRMGVVAFGWERAVACGEDAPISNLVIKLRRNEFRGVVEGQARLVAHSELHAADDPADVADAGDEAINPTHTVARDAWLREFHAVVTASPDCDATDPSEPGEFESVVTDRRGESSLAVLLELSESVESHSEDSPFTDSPVLLVNEPSLWRARLAALRAVKPASAERRVMSFSQWATWPDPLEHVVVGEPPVVGVQPGRATQVTFAWTKSTFESVLASVKGTALTRSDVVATYRTIKNGPGQSLDQLVARLSEDLPTATRAALAVRVLAELGLAKLKTDGETVEAITVSGDTQTSLDRSPTFRSYSEVEDQTQRWLDRLTPTKTTLAA
ncbi:MAG: single-stranded-DNA-specific exonuclease RecJ [Actinobacteria bacterium]|nr:single-stranded-DNA-specific exonuclease RecJ [Actinomycetota bacterium]